MDRTLTFQSRLAVPAEVAFNWHLREGTLERLIPPWQRVKILDRRSGIADGGTVMLKIYAAGVPTTWVAKYTDYIPGQQFCDVQQHGPFAKWRHEHRIEPVGENACVLTDHITYRLPVEWLGARLGDLLIRRTLEATFAYRHAVTRDDLMQQQQASEPLTIALTGSHGLVGAALMPKLTTAGHTVKPLVRRREAEAGEIAWLPEQNWIDAQALEGVDAVIHLAGEPILGRWNGSKKQRIRESRVQGTRLLAETLAGLDHKPVVLLSASAIGYYGSRGSTALTEEAKRGDGFLAEVADEWEAAARPAADAGIRVAHPRFGMVLSPAGGALKQMLPLFKTGIGGRVGPGTQWVSWVAIDDAHEALHHALMDEQMTGPFNVVAPEPLTNAEFVRTLSQVLGRPAAMPAPAFMLRLAMGDLAEEALLASQRVQPAKLKAHSYAFRYPQLDQALRHLLGQESAPSETPAGAASGHPG